jgi:DNA-binding CsgD family transcriptional regulator
MTDSATPPSAPPGTASAALAALDCLPRFAAGSRGDAQRLGAVEAIERASAVLGWDEWAGDAGTCDTSVLIEMLDHLRAVFTARITGDGPEAATTSPRESATAIVELEAARRELREQALEQRMAALMGVQAALARLRSVDSASAILDAATSEICRSGGFTRSVLFRVLDRKMVAVSVYIEGNPEGAAALLQVGRENPADLNHLLLETEMIRRRGPMLVTDVQDDPRVHQAIALATGSPAYVAAPIMPEGDVIGFLHADTRRDGRDLDEFDRDMLWTFAEGFGYAFQRTVLMQRVGQQRTQIRSMISSTERLIDELCDTDVEVGRIARHERSAAGRAAAMLTVTESRVGQLLTRRESEVISLMAAGETNSGIAQRLVISEGTVKSHVKHILRKLRATNRAEAVSRYLRISALEASR